MIPEALPTLHAELGKAAQSLGTGNLANPKGALSVLRLFTTAQINFCFACMKGYVLNTQLPLK